MNNLPIGMFDSGIGGLTLFSQIEQLLPNETLYYLADNSHFPYGTKGSNEIVEYSLQNAHFLLEKKVKLLLVACFTASLIAHEALAVSTDVPVISVVDGLVEELEQCKNSSRVALLGTKATIESGLLEKRLMGKEIFPLVASELVKSIEEKDEKRSKELLLHYRDFFMLHRIDTVALACTHFPHARPLMREVWGPKITVVDGISATVARIASCIDAADVKGVHQFFSSVNKTALC